MTPWHSVERAVVKPLERLCRPIVREHERGYTRAGQGSHALHRFLVDRADVLAVHWRTTPVLLVRDLHDDGGKPRDDADLASAVLGTIESTRDEAYRDGRAVPDHDPRWRAASQALAQQLRAGSATREAVQAAVRAAGQVRWIALARGEQDVWLVPRARLRDEVRSVPGDARWHVQLLDEPEFDVHGWWVCTWRGGRGRLRYPLTEPTGAYVSRVWLHLDAEPQPETPAPSPDTSGKTNTSEIGAQCMRSEGDNPATVADETQHETTGREDAPTEDPMAEPKTETESKPESTPVGQDTTFADISQACDDRGVNLSLFGKNGRKQASVVLYTRTKPSRQVARAKAATLHEAISAVFAAYDADPETGKPTDADTPANADKPADEAGGKDMF